MSALIVTPEIVGPTENCVIGKACYHYARSLANSGLSTTVLLSSPIKNGTLNEWRQFYADKQISFFALEELLTDDLYSRGRVYCLRWHGVRSHVIMEFLLKRDFKYVLFQDWHANGYWSVRCKQLGAGLETTTLGVITHAPNEWQREHLQSFGIPIEDAALEWEERQTIAGADVLISPSHDLIAWLRAHNYTLPKHVAICPYTFEDETHPARPDQVDRDHIVVIGREVTDGLGLLGDALRHLQVDGAHLPRKVSLLGPFEEIEDAPAESYISALKGDLADGIEFVVHTDFDYTQAVDYVRNTNGVVIIPPFVESFPLTVVDAIANGFSFLAPEAGGIPEMVDARVLFQPDVAGLADKLRNLDAQPFSDLVHPYHPDTARTVWREHVAERLKKRKRIKPPRVDPTSVGVSVCIAFYRFDRYLPRLISSFLAMRDPNLQLVVVNDGTPEDECPEFLRLKGKLELLGHVFHMQDNAGAGVARNKAVELARHQYLLFFDADNLPFPNLVSALRRAILRSGADSVSAPYCVVPPLYRPTPSDVEWLYHPPGGPLIAALTDNVLGDTCGIQRRETFEKIGGFPTNKSYYDDWEYYIKLVGRGYRHLVYPQPLFYYECDPNGRRTTQSEYEKRIVLWENLRNLGHDVMGDLLQVLASHVYATR